MRADTVHRPIVSGEQLREIVGGLILEILVASSGPIGVVPRHKQSPDASTRSKQPNAHRGVVGGEGERLQDGIPTAVLGTEESGPLRICHADGRARRKCLS